MNLDIEELKKKIDIYFATHTKEQIHQDMLDAGLETYSQVPNFLEDCE